MLLLHGVDVCATAAAVECYVFGHVLYHGLLPFCFCNSGERYPTVVMHVVFQALHTNSSRVPVHTIQHTIP